MAFVPSMGLFLYFKSKQAFDPRFYQRELARYLSWNVFSRPRPSAPLLEEECDSILLTLLFD